MCHPSVMSIRIFNPLNIPLDILSIIIGLKILIINTIDTDDAEHADERFS